MRNDLRDTLYRPEFTRLSRKSHNSVTIIIYLLPAAPSAFTLEQVFATDNVRHGIRHHIDPAGIALADLFQYRV